MSTTPRVVVIGAGIVGANLADELTARGWTDVTVLDQGPLDLPGGSTSHAPGLVFQTNASRTMSAFASYTVEKFLALGGAPGDGDWCFNQVGGLEVATTPERLADLHRRQGWATSWGIPAEVVDADECVRRHPLLDRDRVLGGLATPTDGLAKASRAVTALIRRARGRGAAFHGSVRVPGVSQRAGRVTGVRTDAGEFPADVVVSCAGFWGREIGDMVGMRVPLLPLAHQYAFTGQIAELVGRNDEASEAGLPILRHQDQDLYYREHHDRLGIGSYAHRPMPVSLAELPEVDEVSHTRQPSMLPFTDDDFAPSWEQARLLLPALGDAKVEAGFNGVFSFTPDGGPLIGESADVAGFWIAEAVWVTHSAGVARSVAQLLVDGRSELDLHGCSVHRFSACETTDAFVSETAQQNFVEIYDVIHPLAPRTSPRGVRVSPFHARQRELGAVFSEAHGWERPQWFEANAGLVEDLPDAWQPPQRDAWSAMFHSPIAAAEAWKTRTGVAMYDMTPLTRIEVAGPGAVAFLDRLTTGKVDKSVGSVTYTLMLDEVGGVRSDLTVARLGPELFQVGANGTIDVDTCGGLRPIVRAPATAASRSGTSPAARAASGCGAARAGPRGAAVAGRLLTLRARVLPVPAGRDRGHPGGGDAGLLRRRARLGDLHRRGVRAAALGRPVGVRTGSRGDRRRAGRVQQPAPGEGLPRLGRRHVLGEQPVRGRGGLRGAARVEGVVRGAGRPDGGGRVDGHRRLTCLTVDDPREVVLGHEPVLVDGVPSGYVTSAAFGHTVGRPIAYAWLPAGLEVGRPVTIRYFGRDVRARVAAEPLVDPEMARIRR